MSFTATDRTLPIFGHGEADANDFIEVKAQPAREYVSGNRSKASVGIRIVNRNALVFAAMEGDDFIAWLTDDVDVLRAIVAELERGIALIEADNEG